MLTKARQDKILKTLQEMAVVSVKDLCELLEVSESTIRRDLLELEEMNLLERIHGGAQRINHLTFEPTMEQKSSQHLDSKQAIAQLALAEINDYDTLYLDAGTTTYALANLIDNQTLTIVTNGLDHAQILLNKGIDTRVIGGKVKSQTRAVTGAAAVKQLSSYRFAKVFLGMNGVSLDYGLTTPDEEEARLKSVALKHGKEAFVLADASKFNQVTFAEVASIDKVTILSHQLSRHINESDLEEYKQKTTIKE